jgi:hypothetical protein
MKQKIESLTKSPAELFGAAVEAGDVDRVRQLLQSHADLVSDVRLVQSTYPLRAHAADVGMFFGIYSRSAQVRLAQPLSSARRGLRRGHRIVQKKQRLLRFKNGSL